MAPFDPNVDEHNQYMRSLGPIDPSTIQFTSIPEPTSENAFCTLTFIRTGVMTKFPRDKILLDAPKGVFIELPVYSFVIEKPAKDPGSPPRRVIYELGLRYPKDHEKPRYKELDEIWGVTAIPSVAQLLESKKIELSTVEAMILGHAHFDHIGDLRTLPPSVDLVVGAGSPVGEELADEMDVPLSTIEQRTLKPLDLEKDFNENIGSLPGHDYFGDGSLWLLDTPGHKPGHVTALVRTQVSPPLYYILGSDTAHHRSLLHYDPNSTTKCGLFDLAEVNPDAPDGYLTSMHSDLRQAYQSIAKIARMDQEENVVCLLAHDASLESVVPKGDFVSLDGDLRELKRLKARS